MHIDTGIDIGTLILIGTIIVGMIGAHFAVQGAVGTLSARFDDFRRDVEKQTDALNVRLDRHESVIRDVSGTVQRVVGEMSFRRAP